VVQVYFNIDVPMSVANIFYGWGAGLGNQFKSLILVGAGALCWALWTSRNDIVFDNSLIKTYMQVLYRGMDACSSVESTVMHILVRLMGGGSLIGLLLLDFDFDIGIVIRITMVRLCCVSWFSLEFRLSYFNSSNCNCGHILVTR
jgi:hypothetical protein